MSLTAPVLAYRARLRTRGLLIAGIAVLAVACFLLDLATGPGNLPLSDILAAVFSPDAQTPRLRVIVWDIRLPVATMALVIGAMLGLAGAQMQTILANPLADPFTLGLSSAASVGAAVAIVMGWALLPGLAGNAAITANAFVFALFAAGLVYLLTLLRGVTSETMILFGIALLFAFNALLGLLQYRASEVQLQQIIFWMMGSLGRSNWTRIAIAAGVLAVAAPLLWRRRWALTAIRMGEERARSLGVDVRRIRLEVLALVSLLAATAVSFVGVIGFIGLVGPHIARLLVGEDQRFFVPLSALSGALICSATSVVAKTLVPGTIFPLGIITALVGVPFFLSLVLSRRGRAA
ncbi:FecCD family ABC transporter permease [Roseomonas sp. CCTCC AB2023176]|uniref:FecCD family ABC transporter permease n=1 Tax=Roseomonas sp. CCTCC AB2023176 TaxID=3342640 RepID=UPI0035D7636E